MSKASETKLNTLHAVLAETLTTMVQAREVEETDSQGKVSIVTKDPSPAALAVAAKFLKDNSIFSTPEGDERIKGLEEALADRRRKRTISREDLEGALGQVGRELLQ